MWVATNKGYFSAVAMHGRPGWVTVRTRVRADARAFAAHVWARSVVLAVDDLIHTSSESDYPFRVFAPVEAWAKFVAVEASQIDYDNFKAEVAARQGEARAAVYHDAWLALTWLEDNDPERRPKRPRWLTAAQCGSADALPVRKPAPPRTAVGRKGKAGR